MRKVFITFHHDNDQSFKNRLLEINAEHRIFIDKSVDTRDISDDLSDSAIREKIRDEYLRDSTVTIVLVGLETKKRKHVDWEIYSSMINGAVNKKSGILVINLPSIKCTYFHVGHEDAGEKEAIYPEVANWTSIDDRSEYESRYPYMPDRIIDQLCYRKAKVSAAPWSRIEDDPNKLAFLIEAAFDDRVNCEYEFSRPMRRANS